MYRVHSEIDLDVGDKSTEKNRSDSPYNLRSRAKTDDWGNDKNTRTYPAKREKTPPERCIQRRVSIGDCPPLDLERNREPFNLLTS